MLWQSYISDESGAVTVDWVVLTAAIVALGTLVIATLTQPTSGLAVRIGNELAEIDPGH